LVSPAAARRGSVRILRRVWRRHRWQVTVAAAAAGIVLGFIGVGQNDPAASIIDRVYGTLQLFFLAYAPVPGHGISVALQLGRFLAPVAVAYVGLQAVAALFVQQASELRIRALFRRHLVICGLGRAGLDFAIAFAADGTKVVAVDVEPSARAIDECKERAIPLLIGDASDRALLVKAGVGRARAVVVTCGDDNVNGDVALTLRASSRARPSPLQCFVHIGDDRLCASLEEAMLLSSDTASTRVEFFNVHRSGPQALLNAYARPTAGGRAPHLLIVGAGEVGTNLAVEAARRSHHGRAPGSPSMQVTLLSPDAEARVAALRIRYPALEAGCRVLAVVGDPADPDRPSFEATGRHNPIEGVTAAFVCTDDDSMALRAALQLRKQLTADVPIVVCTTRRASSVTELLDAAGSNLAPNVHSFAILEQVCTPEVVFNGRRETIARAFHADYADRQIAAGVDPEDGSVRPWDELAETLRQSNRDLAADIGRKLTAVGCGVELMIDWDTPLFEFTPAELDILAPLEHDRWWAERRRQGWTFGPTKDVAARRSPDLVPWAELSEPVREKDVDTIRLIPTVLATYAGVAVVRRGGPA
jgi:voltage-gated potassium channel Kch